MTRESAVADLRSAPDGTTSGGGRRRPEPGSGSDHCEILWSICVAIAQRRRRGLPPRAFTAGAADEADKAASADVGGGDEAVLRLHRPAGHGWELAGGWSAAAREMFDLYRPLLDLKPGERYLLGHLGQSIDGRIATSSGDSCFINGQQNLIHMHRLRALCDAVLVGAGTVVADDPQLTTRLVPGPNATRVVLDPSMRLTPAYRICADVNSPTLIARLAPPGRPPLGDRRGELPPAEPLAEPPAGPSGATACGSAEIVTVGASAAGIDLPRLLDCLAARRLDVILVEGGGITVSRFLAQGLLNRLQIAIAPVIIGSGRQGLQLPEVLALGDCLRPSYRHHQMGPDVLWDLDLRAAPAAALDSPAG